VANPSDTTSPASASPGVGPPDVELILGEPLSTSIQPLLGVNVGPVPAGRSPSNGDLTQAYQCIGVTLVRTHDFYGPLDMSVMYPDLSKDPKSRESYDFRVSDAVWSAVTSGGFEPYLRLGDSWNNVRAPHAEREMKNWAQACVEVVRHYCQGKWNGFSTAVRYVEIWNEPDNQQFWPRPLSALDYYRLYAETSHLLKEAFPGVQVGGPGLTQAGFMTARGRQWLEDFLVFVKQTDSPLDFFSWHLYSNNPEDWSSAAQFYREALDEAGFRKKAMHVTEWNTDVRGLPDNGPQALALRTGGKGASILTAAWIAMQENGVAVSTIYRGTDPDINFPTFYGIFYADGKPKRTALAFSLWAELVQHSERLTLTASPDLGSRPEPGIWYLAGGNAVGETAVLIANPTAKPVRYTVSRAARGTPVEDGWRVMEVSDDSDALETWNFTGGVAEIGAETVQLLLLGP